MKVSIAKIINSDKALSNLLDQHLPLGLSIQLGKTVTELEPVYKRANEAREELLSKYGKLDPDRPHVYNVPPENQDTYLKEVTELFDQEIDLMVPTVPVSKLPEACITAKDAIALSWLLTIDDN